MKIKFGSYTYFDPTKAGTYNAIANPAFRGIKTFDDYRKVLTGESLLESDYESEYTNNLSTIEKIGKIRNELDYRRGIREAVIGDDAFSGVKLYHYPETYEEKAIMQYQQLRQYKFDKNHFNELINNRQYEDAADYAEHYHFDDPKKQRLYENNIINLRREGAQLASIYGQITNVDDLKDIEFLNAINTDGGLERLQTTDKSDPNYNIVAASFIDAKDYIGDQITTNMSGSKIKEDGRKAKGIQLTFNNLWPSSSIEDFYKQSGLSEYDLKNAGIDIEHKDTKTIVKFDKSNSLANKILLSLPYNNITSLPTQNKIILEGYDENGTFFGNHTNIQLLQGITNNAQRTKTKLEEKVKSFKTDNLYSSTVGPMITDELANLNSQLESGIIDKTEYNRQARIIAPHVFNAIYTFGSGEYEMYSNLNNNESTDETLIPLDNHTRGEVVNEISKTDPSDMVISSMVSNGKIGVLITLKASRFDKKDENKKRVQVFIPGLLQEEAQEKINRNTSTRAVQELNSIIDYGYDFRLYDGNKLSVDNKGNFIIGNTPTSKQDAIREINKTFIIEDGAKNLKYNYTNVNGKLFDTEGYEATSRRFALNAIQDLYPDINLIRNEQTNEIFLSDATGRIYSSDDIFNKDLDINNISYETYKKLEEVYDIYNRLMNEITYR